MSKALSSLREAIGAIEGTGIAGHPALQFGIDPIDAGLADRGLRIDALHEVAGAGPNYGDDAAASLFLAGIAARNAGSVLWIVRRRDLFAPGLYQAGLAPERLIHAEARDDAELLAIMEDALRHRGLGAVVGEPKRAGMTATRRLQLAAEGGRTLALMLRRPSRAGDDPFAQPSAAATRWRVGCLPSEPLPVAGIGRARWRLELVRQRGGAPFAIDVEACDETGRCALAAELVDRPDRAGRADARAVG
ncbi:ImuA family protein [Stakelama saccharophila]|uniref:Protein ImuA n=1 Tax=Stakelama saccharophila TaxID=3075605 RepID=A0ABZ0B4W6_9SPHN|nr:protein ImuA [Stakelama sp. W311]WNO52431.1 protein ImuA [Stakelama sp. W311]